MNSITNEERHKIILRPMNLSNMLVRNTLLYFIFSALVALFIYLILQDEGETSALLDLWIICIEANTIILAFVLLLSKQITEKTRENNIIIAGVLCNGLIWGILGGTELSQIPPDFHVLIIMSLVGIVGLGAPVISSSYFLVMLFSSLVLLPPAFYFLTEMNAVSMGKGLVITALIPVVVRVVKIYQNFLEKTNTLQEQHQTLINQLNQEVKKSELANAELINEINNKLKTEAELISARDAAEEAVRAKSEFLATMSHEIRTPMNGILGMTELLIDTNLTSKQHRFAETIHKSGNALLTIINDILDFSKIEAGKLELNNTVFDLRLLIEDLGVMFAEQTHRKGLELSCQYPADGHAAFRGDPVRIRQILVNLIGNAIKFTEKGEVSLKVELFEKENDHFLVRFRVQDTGIGIAPEVQKKIFDSFSQADGTTTRKFGGTGLGLSISKKLTHLMKGKIGVKSQADHGSTFWFAIPLKKEKALKQPLSAIINPVFKNTRLLIADHNASSRIILEQQCTNWGISFYSVKDGKEALRIIRQARQQNKPFNLAIIENKLPGLDAISLAQKIKSEPDIADTKLIILSSIGNMEETGQWLMAGVESYLNKPIRQNELHESLCKALLKEHIESADSNITNTIRTASETLVLKGHILVAEDNFVNQELAREMITKLGCSIEIAANGKLAFEAITECPLDNLQRPYDLILMDCQMPEMDGFQATREIREWESLQKIAQHIPVIALTANAMEGDRERCLAAGMDDYMTKPFNLEQLAAMLHRWLPLLAKENRSEFMRVNEAISRSQSEFKDQVSVQTNMLDPAALNKIRTLQRKGQPNVVIKVIKLFIENSQKTVQALEAAAAKGDHEALRRAAYSLQSSCNTIGATDLSKLCVEIEALAKQGNAEKAQSRLSVFEYEYDAVCAALEQQIKLEKVTESSS